MIRARKKIILCVAMTVFGSLFSFLFLHSAYAQNFGSTIEARDISMNIDPKTPGTNEKITVSLESYIINVNRLRITWFVNGEIVLSGTGETEIQTTTGSQGELTSIEAYIQVDSGTNLRKWIQIAPADLDILWQADTYTPPFYRGKALPTPESFIKIVGLPNLKNEGAQSQEKKIVFNWTQNNTNLPDSSGFGENPLVIRNDFLTREEIIDLKVVHRDGLTTAEASVAINIVDPEVVLYKQGVGLRNANTLTPATNNQDLVLRAEPYFFSAKRELLGLLNFDWIVNAKTIGKTSSPIPNELPVEFTGQQVAEIGVAVSNRSKPFQISPVATARVIQ